MNISCLQTKHLNEYELMYQFSTCTLIPHDNFEHQEISLPFGPRLTPQQLLMCQRLSHVQHLHEVRI